MFVSNAKYAYFACSRFGNAIELILCINALRAGRMNLILNTIVGSILSNLLLVMGSAFVAGGCRFKEQTVLLAVAEANSDMLSFAVFGLCIPSLFSMAISSGSVKQQSIESMSLVCAICLLIMYVLYLIFSLYTHAEFYEPPSGIADSVELGDSVDGEMDVDHARSIASLPLAVTVLSVTIVTVTIASELLIGALDGFSKSVGFTESFIAVIFLPVIGNAVEHFSAILVAYRDKIDLAIGIACGSSVQIALFAAPVIVICSWFIPGPRLTLSFDVFQTAALAFSVFVVNATLRDTKTNWLEGAVLVMCYIILAAAFFFMP
jgi:Ca2+:H+ antiporter